MPTEPVPDPLVALHLPATPLAPRPSFAAALRRRIQTALEPANPTREETTMSDTTTAAVTTSPVVPYLAVRGAAAALDWYRDALGAVETLRYVGDDGRVGHAEFRIGDATFMLADEHPEIGVVGPATLGNTSVALYLPVVDVDHTYDTATAAGAESARPPEDQSHGNRTATIIDPFGHRWMLSQPIESLTAAELDAREANWAVSGPPPVEPGYLVFHTTDADRSIRFFERLFGWSVDRTDLGGHVANTRFPMGFAGGDSGDRVGVFFRVDDVDRYATLVEELGGRILARHDYPSGGNVECEDDQGNRFDLWKPAPGY